jgi:hypothetical protein
LLQEQIHITNFVQKDRPAISLFEPPNPPRVGVGEGSSSCPNNSLSSRFSGMAAN